VSDMPYTIYLSVILNKLLEQYRSWQAVERRIAASMIDHGFVNRHKLRTLAQGDLTEVVTFAQLLSIERVAADVHESLFKKPFFQLPEDLFSHVARMTRVVSLLSARHVVHEGDKKRNVLADYDVLGMLDFYTHLSEFGPRAKIDYRDIVLRDSVTAAITAVKPYVNLLSEPEIALVTIGSSRANHFTEELLCRMCGVDRFSAQPLGSLPFHFIFPASDQPKLPSAFQPDQGALEATEPKKAKSVREGSRAMVASVNGAQRVWLAEPREWHRSRDLGIIAYQRRQDGQLWIVFAGLSGAGTLGAVKTATQCTLPVPAHTAVGTVPLVHYAPIEVKLQEDSARDGSAIRHIINVEMLCAPQVWEPQDPAAWLEMQVKLGALRPRRRRRQP